MFVGSALGAHWRDLPDRYGKWKTVHRRFSRWCHAGVWKQVFEALTADRDNKYLMLDSTIVRAHQQAASGKGEAKDQALGRSRGGLTTKIHMLADTLGRLLRFIVTARQIGDVTQAPALLKGQEGHAVLADIAYDSNALHAIIAQIGAEAVIPSNRTRKIIIPPDAIAYKQRNRIEQRFNRLKHFRRAPHTTNAEQSTSAASYSLLPLCSGYVECRSDLGPLFLDLALFWHSRMKIGTENHSNSRWRSII